MPTNVPNPKHRRKRSRKKKISRGDEKPVILGVVRKPKPRLTTQTREFLRYVQRYPGTPMVELVNDFGSPIIKRCLGLGLIRFESQHEAMPVFCDAAGWKLLP